jgi:hypothetical protein
VGVWSGDEFRTPFLKKEMGFCFIQIDEYWEKYKEKDHIQRHKDQADIMRGILRERGLKE